MTDSAAFGFPPALRDELDDLMPGNAGPCGMCGDTILGGRHRGHRRDHRTAPSRRNRHGRLTTRLVSRETVTVPLDPGRTGTPVSNPRPCLLRTGGNASTNTTRKDTGVTAPSCTCSRLYVHDADCTGRVAETTAIDKIADLRAAGMSLAKIARCIDVHVDSVSGWSHGTHRPHWRNEERLDELHARHVA